MPELPSGTVTFLFSDIEGSTRLLNELGSERYSEELAKPSLWGVGYIRLEEGDHRAAEDLLIQAVDLMREVGSKAGLLWATRTLAFTYFTMGDLKRARPLYEENLRQSRETGDRALETATLGGLSMIALGEGRLADAVAIERESLRLVIHLNDELMMISRLCNAASVLSAVGRPDAATRLLTFAQARYHETEAQEPWVTRMNDETLASIHRQLDEAAFSNAWEQGSTVTPENALRLATAEMEAADNDLRR